MSSAPASVAASGAAAKPAASAPAKPAASSATGASAKPAGSTAVSPAASGLTKVKAAYSQISAVQGPLYVAIDQKFFQKHGLEVDAGLVSGTAQPPAMMAGELQFGTPGGNELVSADLAGASLVMIAAASNYPVFSMYAGKGINELKDLAGKSVAITSAGSSTDAAARLYLRHFNLDKQVKLQPSGSIQGILAVVEKGDVAAGIVSPPTTALADKAGLKELVNGPKLGLPLTHSGVTVTRDYLKSKPEVVKGFLQGYLDAWNFSINPANEAAVEQSLAKWTKSTQAIAKASYDYVEPAWAKDKLPTVSPEGIQNVLSLVSNPNAKTAKPEQFIDNSILQSLGK
ncbi:MAG TPA: ABC transporter substrate-binding protein [Chloroflexota bacterium]|nr:ABC transporter substrate-binding protein [Chloroflexota bacterium]